MENDRVCSSCGRMVDKTKRFAIMVDGILQVSVPLCFPCYEDINDHVIPMLNKRGSHAVH